MSFWGDVGEGIGLRYTLVVCFLLLFLSVMTQSWVLFLIMLAILLIGTVDSWLWWLPGMSRHERAAIPITGAARRKLRTKEPRTWLVQEVAFYRSVGFFARDAFLTDPQVADKIGADFDAASPQADYLLLKADADRVWWEDLEADVCAENRVYERVLPDWGRISAGVFQPTDVNELWEDDRGPVTVEFKLDRRSHIVSPEYCDDYIDLGVLSEINELIAGSGREFVVAHTGDQTGFVMCLTPEERQRLVRERGWRFI